MAMAVGAHTVYDENTVGNREDLSDIINDVSPTETPGLTGMGRVKATNTKHEFLTDALAAAADNKALDGAEFTGVARTARTRLYNICQILTKQPVVSGSQMAADTAGIKNEMAYQVANCMAEIKRDLERAIFGVTNLRVAGDSTTEREMGSFNSFLATNDQIAAATSASGSGDGSDVPTFGGDDRAMDETIFNAGLQSLFTNSGGDSSVTCLTSAGTKGVISGFTGADERYANTDDKTLVTTLDVYVGDFHTVAIVPDRYCVAGANGITFIVDFDYLKLAEYRKLHTQDIAKTGDSVKKGLVWECTVEVCNEKAHVQIGDLTT